MILTRTNIATAALIACLASSPSAQASDPEDAFKQEVVAGLEEIFVFRTTRTEQQQGATPDCAAAPFTSAREDRYDLWSMELRASDGRVVRTHLKPVGNFRACFTQFALGMPLGMYAMGTVGNVSWIGSGECLPTQSQPPVRTVLAFNCQLNLSGLPEGYAGGMATSSTAAPLLPREAGPTAHVPGYLSTSVVTIRFWKKPKEKSAPPLR
jgi:hypothetical protein